MIQPLPSIKEREPFEDVIVVAHAQLFDRSEISFARLTQNSGMRSIMPALGTSPCRRWRGQPINSERPVENAPSPSSLAVVPTSKSTAKFSKTIALTYISIGFFSFLLLVTSLTNLYHAVVWRRPLTGSLVGVASRCVPLVTLSQSHLGATKERAKQPSHLATRNHSKSQSANLCFHLHLSVFRPYKTCQPELK